MEAHSKTIIIMEQHRDDRELETYTAHIHPGNDRTLLKAVRYTLRSQDMCFRMVIMVEDYQGSCANRYPFRAFFKNIGENPVELLHGGGTFGPHLDPAPTENIWIPRCHWLAPTNLLIERSHICVFRDQQQRVMLILFMPNRSGLQDDDEDDIESIEPIDAADPANQYDTEGMPEDLSHCSEPYYWGTRTTRRHTHGPTQPVHDSNEVDANAPSEFTQYPDPTILDAPENAHVQLMDTETDRKHVPAAWR